MTKEVKRPKENDSNPRYNLFAHQIGTNNFVLATSQGTLMACGRTLVNSMTQRHSFITFQELSEELMTEQQKLEEMKIIPKGSASSRFIRKLTGMIEDAIMYLGQPPKEEVEFYSMPDEIRSQLKWKPKTTDY